MFGIRNRLALLFLKYFPRLSALRRIPVLGVLLHQLSCRILRPETRVWVRVRQGVGKGLWLSLNPRTGKDYSDGRVEPLVQQTLRLHLEPGMVFYDIGANIGFFSLIAARLLGKQGRVLAFEADPEAVERLKGNLERNSLMNVVVLERAVWSTSGSVAFLRCDPRTSPDLGLGKVAVLGEAGDKVIVPSITLDDCIALAPPPAFIKCDVEGAELDVFRAGRNVLAQYKPKVVCEVHSQASLQALRDLFCELGYEVSLLDSSHLLALPA